MVDIDFVPSLLEPLVEVFLGILLGEIVPLADDVLGGLHSIFLCQYVVAIGFASLVSSWF